MSKLSIWAGAGSVFLLFIIAILIIANWDAWKSQKKYTLAVLALSAGIFVSLSFLFYKFVVDDVYISLRYARNFADGHGLVFNTDGSAPVEGYTNFLWVLMESLLFVLKIPDDLIVDVIKFIGIAFGLGILLVVFRLMRLFNANDGVNLTGVLFLASVPELAFWAVGGLETTMYIFWLVMGFYMYIVEKRRGKPHVGSFFFFTLMALTRPEGLFITLALILFDVFISVRNRKSQSTLKAKLRPIIAGATLFLVIYGVYFLWRYNYYGHPFPNSFYAKKLTGSVDFLHRFKQASDFIFNLFPFFAIGSLGYLAFKKENSTERCGLLSLMLLLLAFSYAARNEWMPGYRYELPFVPFLIVFFMMGIGRVLNPAFLDPVFGRRHRIIRFAAMFFLGIFLLYPYNELRLTGDAFSRQLHAAHIPLGKWLNKYAPPNASYASWDMGATPYFSGLDKVIDINSEGLLNPHTTHKGYDVDFLISQNPSFLVLPPNTDYVQPPDILRFYSMKKLQTDYEYLFSVSFTDQYLLKVYKDKKVKLSPEALKEGMHIAAQSKSLIN